MNVSLRMAMIMATIFGGISLAFAITGFLGIGDIADPTEASDARGFALFWTFLATVAIGLGALAWWIERRERGSHDDG